jgi:hypothetical protein
MRDVNWLFVGFFLLGCLKDRAALDAQCAFNDECTAPLVCAARRCRAPCRSDRDCTNLLRCRPSGQYRQRVCLPPDAPVPCLFSSECNAVETGTVCLRDGLCHRQCERNYDCQVYTAGSTCLPGGVCSFNPCLGQDAGCGARPAPSDAGPEDAPSEAAPAVDAGPASCAPWACEPGAPGCTVEQVAVGFGGVCARFSDGTLRCWSSDRGDILANGRNERCPVPGLVQNLPGRALDVAVGGSAVCARTTLGVYCWGQNRNGELALGRPPEDGALAAVEHGPSGREDLPGLEPGLCHRSHGGALVLGSGVCGRRHGPPTQRPDTGDLALLRRAGGGARWHPFVRPPRRRERVVLGS